MEGRTLFEEDPMKKAAAAHKDALVVLTRMHKMSVHEAAERKDAYRKLLGSPAWRSLKDAMDLWCACWFWPSDRIEVSPLPTSFTDPPEETRAVARQVAARHRFFHWELEFPDVFREEGAGFDAVLGNPPWDIAKPVSMEFFANIDPLYRSYGKQEALRRQTEYFADESVERDWLDYCADFRARSNYVTRARNPFGDPALDDKSQNRFIMVRGKRNDAFHARWRAARRRSTGFADLDHPFRHQGSADLNLYKLFLEVAHALAGPGGRIGFLVPSGLYSDHGTGDLRAIFLERCRWEWLFGIENRAKIFPIDSRSKFNPVIVEKGGSTDAIQTAFMRRDLEDWERAEDLATPYTRAQIQQFSPKSRAILEIQSQRDLEILEKIYANSVLLGDDGPDGWGIKYVREFDMTGDSKLFPPRPKWEANGLPSRRVQPLAQGRLASHRRALNVNAVRRALALTALFNSVVSDFVTRGRVTGLHLDYHVLEQNALVSLDHPAVRLGRPRGGHAAVVSVDAVPRARHPRIARRGTVRATKASGAGCHIVGTGATPRAHGRHRCGDVRTRPLRSPPSHETLRPA